MKKVITILALILSSLNLAYANVVDFKTAFAQAKSKPAIVFVYASWMETPSLLDFKSIETKYANRANFVELDITKPNSEDYFNTYPVMQKIPQILMIRSGGKITRFVPNDCVNNSSCLLMRVKQFLE